MPNRLLVPLDLTPLSETKLPVIEEYGRALQAETILLHVVPSGPLPRPFEHGESEGMVSPEEARAGAFLDTFAMHLRGAGLIANPLVLHGPVAERVLQTARQEAVSLIILGSTIRRGLPRLWLGSIAEAIVRQAPCPVLLLRPPDDVSLAPTAIRSFAEDSARVGLLTPRQLGLREVDVARIVGSVGKASELAANFRPVKQRRAEDQRYRMVLDASTREGLSPVELYKLGYGYYVVDGHRRVAAAKVLGYTEIPANVTEFVPVDTSDQQLFTGRRAFERATGLTSVGAARVTSYPRLIELIQEFQRIRGLEDLHEAARRWRVSVYGPLIERVRALRLNRYFPGERSADIVVRIADHRRAEEARLGHEVSWDDAIMSFATQPRER